MALVRTLSELELYVSAHLRLLTRADDPLSRNAPAAVADRKILETVFRKHDERF